jgi:hypothetical protein
MRSGFCCCNQLIVMRNLILLAAVNLIFAALLITSCTKKECERYRFDRHFTPQQRDTLLVDMVTLIGKKPKTANYLTRHEAHHRPHYINLTSQFEMIHFHVTPSDTAYFYMIRPARSTQGITRGVGGKFTLDELGKPAYFEELFNTPVNDREELIKIGCLLFMELLNSGNVDAYLWNSDYIEWPDDRLKYDTEKQEWRFDVVR